MDIVEKFIRQISYKFPKGYPDMNNEQDVVLLNSLLEDLDISLSEKKALDEAGKKFERQEQAFINAVKNASVNGPIGVKFKNKTLYNITGAEKYSKATEAGKEPITDVVLNSSKGDINISMKGSSSPSLAGGGLTGLKTISPDLVNNFITSAYEKLVSKGLKTGDALPDIYSKIPDDIAATIIRGNEASGGPIDFIYIGPMDVVSSLDDNTLTIENANLLTPEEVSKKNLYLRLRKRREDQRFDATPPQSGKLPKLITKSPSKGDSNFRIVITDSVPSNALIV